MKPPNWGICRFLEVWRFCAWNPAEETFPAEVGSTEIPWQYIYPPPHCALLPRNYSTGNMFTSRPFKVLFVFYLIAFNSTAGKLCFPSVSSTCSLEGIIHLSVCMCLYKIALGCSQHSWRYCWYGGAAENLKMICIPVFSQAIKASHPLAAHSSQLQSQTLQPVSLWEEAQVVTSTPPPEKTTLWWGSSCCHWSHIFSGSCPMNCAVFAVAAASCHMPSDTLWLLVTIRFVVLPATSRALSVSISALQQEIAHNPPVFVSQTRQICGGPELWAAGAHC